MIITRVYFIISMWNLWSSLGFLILGIYTIHKSPIMVIPLLMFSITFFSMWSLFIYDLLIERNKK